MCLNAHVSSSHKLTKLPFDPDSVENHVLREENMQLKGRVNELETQVCGWLHLILTERRLTAPCLCSLRSSAILSSAKDSSLEMAATSERTIRLLLPEPRSQSLRRVLTRCSIAFDPAFPLCICTSFTILSAPGYVAPVRQRLAMLSTHTCPKVFSSNL